MLLERTDGWIAMLRDKTLVSMGDSGCLPVAATSILHKAGFAEADSGVPDRAAWLACGAVNNAGRVTLPPDPIDCSVRDGDLHAGVAVVTSGLLDSAGGRAEPRGAAMAVGDLGEAAGRGETINPAIGPTNSVAVSVNHSLLAHLCQNPLAWLNRRRLKGRFGLDPIST